MVKHGALSKSHVHQMLASKDARVRRAAYTLLEASNPALRRNSELFLEIIRFIWEANPSYDIYREFNKRHLIVPYKVHELISARLKVEKQEQLRAAVDQRTDETRRDQGGFFQRLFGRRPPALQGREIQESRRPCTSLPNFLNTTARDAISFVEAEVAWLGINGSRLQVRGDDAGDPLTGPDQANLLTAPFSCARRRT